MVLERGQVAQVDALHEAATEQRSIGARCVRNDVFPSELFRKLGAFVGHYLRWEHREGCYKQCDKHEYAPRGPPYLEELGSLA